MDGYHHHRPLLCFLAHSSRFFTPPPFLRIAKLAGSTCESSCLRCYSSSKGNKKRGISYEAPTSPRRLRVRGNNVERRNCCRLPTIRESGESEFCRFLTFFFFCRNRVMSALKFFLFHSSLWLALCLILVP